MAVDIILLLCFIPAIIRGLTRGFVRQLVALVAIVAGAWTANHYSGRVPVWLGGLFGSIDPRVTKVVAYVLVALAAIAVLLLLGRLLDKVADALSLSFLNRLAGVILGVLCTTLVLGLLILILEQVNEVFGFLNKEMLDDATVYHWIKDISAKIFPFLKNLFEGIEPVLK